MSLLTNQTSLNNSEFFFLRGTGSQINVSTLNANSISTNQLTANSTIANQLSTVLLDANDINASTIFAYEVFIDNQGLTATPSELLLNGVPIATTANLSSIQDWSLFPAVSTLDMNGYNILSTNNVVASNVNAGTGIFQNLFANNIFALSTYTSTISTLAEVADFGFIDTLSTGSATGGNFAPSTLWGEPSSFYQDLVSTISSFNSDNINCSTLTANTWICTPQLTVSSINGSEFTSTGITVQVAGVSSLVANTISSIGAELRTALVSTLQFNPSFSPNLDVNLGLGSLFGNLAGAAAGGLGVLVGGAALGTGIAALAQGRQTNYINSNSYELVNGTTQLQISTLGDAFSTIYRFVSSPAENVPGEEIFISTVYPAGLAIRSMSDPLNTTSSPNSTIQAFGQWVALPEVPAASTISSFSDIYTSSLAASTISFNNGTVLRVGATYTNAPGVSTTELLWSDASPPLDANFRTGAIVLSGSDVGGLNYTKDVLVQNANAGNRIEVFPGQSTIAYLQDIGTSPQLFTSSIRAQPGTAVTVVSDTGNEIVSVDSASQTTTLRTGGYAGGQYLQLYNPTGVIATQALNTIGLATTNPGLVDINTAGGSTVNTGNLIVKNGFTQTSTLRASTITLEGQMIINPSTTRSGIYMPYDATNGTGAVAVGLSTSVSVYEKYAALVAITAIPFGAPGTEETAAFLQTTDNEASFQYADLEVGRLLVGGANNYGTNPTGYLTGDAAGNLSAVAASFTTSNASVSTLKFSGISTIYFSTAGTAGTNGQTAGRLTMGGCDLDLGQNDLWAQQLRIGAGNPSGSGQTEIVFYDPTAATTRGFGLGGGDLTIRVQSTINSGTNNGYLLDTTINRPFFSTINNQVNLMAAYPSTTLGNFGVSTLSKMNPVQQYGRSTLAAGTLTIVLGTPYADSNEYSVQATYQDTAGGNPIHANILSVSSFTINGNGTNNFFWTTIGKV